MACDLGPILTPPAYVQFELEGPGALPVVIMRADGTCQVDPVALAEMAANTRPSDFDVQSVLVRLLSAAVLGTPIQANTPPGLSVK